MKHLFHFCLLLILAGVVPLTFGGCSKKGEPAPTTGSLSGTISPAGAISEVKLTNARNLTFITKPDASTGAFQLDQLAPETYRLSFTAARGYLEPATRTVSITEGQTANAGPIEAKSDGSLRGGTMSWTANGTTLTTTNISGSLFDTGSAGIRIALVATAPNGTAIDELSINKAYFSLSPGTYTLDGPYGSAGYKRTSGYLVTGNYATGYYPPTGSLTITSVINGLATGTFDFIARNLNGSSNNMTVTNGTFRLQF